MADAPWRCTSREGRRVRPLRSRADHSVVPRRRRVLDRRVRDLLRADGRVAIARHRAAARRNSRTCMRELARVARRPSPSSTGSTTTCANPRPLPRPRAPAWRLLRPRLSEIRAPPGADAAPRRATSARAARRRGASRSVARRSSSDELFVAASSEVALAPAFVYTAPIMPWPTRGSRSGTGTPRRSLGTVTVNFADLPGSTCLSTDRSSDVNVWGRLPSFLTSKVIFSPGLRLDEGGVEVLVVELHLERRARLRAHVLRALDGDLLRRASP